MPEVPARKQRLSRSADFERVYRQGRSAQHRLLVMYRFHRPEDVRAGDTGGCRIGITVSRKVGGAVERNRLKRQLRAAIQESTQLVDGFDYVAIARPGLRESVDKQGYEWLRQLVDELGGRLSSREAAPQ